MRIKVQTICSGPACGKRVLCFQANTGKEIARIQPVTIADQGFTSPAYIVTTDNERSIEYTIANAIDKAFGGLGSMFAIDFIFDEICEKCPDWDWKEKRF